MCPIFPCITLQAILLTDTGALGTLGAIAVALVAWGRSFGTTLVYLLLIAMEENVTVQYRSRIYAI